MEVIKGVLPGNLLNGHEDKVKKMLLSALKTGGGDYSFDS